MFAKNHETSLARPIFHDSTEKQRNSFSFCTLLLCIEINKWFSLLPCAKGLNKRECGKWHEWEKERERDEATKYDMFHSTLTGS